MSNTAIASWVQQHREDSAAELARWGKPLSAPEWRSPSELAKHGLKRSDLLKLREAGLVESQFVEGYYETRGLFGRGNVRRHPQSSTLWRLTAKVVASV
jgi:hypothetical protein